MNEWEMAQEFERSWWASCHATYKEETKQLTYAYKMGLAARDDGARFPTYDLAGKRILDIGGGPTSILLKCTNFGSASAVVDPCTYPAWVGERYQSAGIGLWPMKAEDLTYHCAFNEAWIYNCLQHVEDPEKIIANARRVAPVIRIFEWIDMAPCEGHPQMLVENELNEWLDGKGTTEFLNENGCYGRAYYGVFES